jgi:hypothetical protein
VCLDVGGRNGANDTDRGHHGKEKRGRLMYHSSHMPGSFPSPLGAVRCTVYSESIGLGTLYRVGERHPK